MACLEVIDLLGKTTECDLAELMNRANFRDDEGCNYVVASRAGEQRYPFLIVYFKDGHSVLAYFEGEEYGVQLLKGDSSVRDDELMQFLSPFEGFDSYTGEFIVSSATAAGFLQAFATGAPWPPSPSWEAM
jgi:hypothetical protein